MKQKFHKFQYFSFKETFIDLNQISFFHRREYGFRIELLIIDKQINFEYNFQLPVRKTKYDDREYEFRRKLAKQFFERDCKVIEDHINGLEYKPPVSIIPDNLIKKLHEFKNEFSHYDNDDDNLLFVDENKIYFREFNPTRFNVRLLFHEVILRNIPLDMQVSSSSSLNPEQDPCDHKTYIFTFTKK